MIVIICGGCNLPRFTTAQTAWLDQLRIKLDIQMVLTGGATGADTWGNEWAESRGIDRIIVHAKRNSLMIRLARLAVEYSGNTVIPDVRVIAFPGGCGTVNISTQAHQAGVPVIRWEVYAEAWAMGEGEALMSRTDYGHTY